MISLLAIIVASVVLPLLAFIGYMEITRPKPGPEYEIQYPVQE